MNLPKKDFVLLETNKFDANNQHSYLFKKPVTIITCTEINKVNKALESVENWAARGYYAAGFLSYEAGYAFESCLKNTRTHKGLVPLVWFGIYRKPELIDKNVCLGTRFDGAYAITGPRPNISRAEYRRAVAKIKTYIKRGDTFQVNYTFKYKFGLKGSPEALYAALKNSQRTSYSALINTLDFSVISASPELFFRIRAGNIETKPMKGTAARGRFEEEDMQASNTLHNSRKNRAENVMIVDLLRNDLSKICAAGSVKTENMFEIEKYGTLFQMVSTVKGRLKKPGFSEIIRNIYPSGSITGAPKIHTMRIISGLEKEPRGVYTGAIGYIAPDGRSVFNVAIRTVVFERGKGRGEMGVGSGITIDSAPGSEYEESCLKAKFALGKCRAFKLFETMLLRREKTLFLLKYHLDRLGGSARYFDYPFDRKKAVKMLKEIVRRVKAGQDSRVRLSLSNRGIFNAELLSLNSTSSRLVRFSSQKTNSKDRFIFHKTTNRELYSRELARCKNEGYYDVIFTNEKGQITESAASNIFIQKGSVLYTPPVSCGLLAGTYRRYLMETENGKIKEKILCKEDIYAAEKVYLANSVRGLVEVKLK